MFRTLINDAKSAAGSIIGKYAIRASVAVPFIVAAGFGTAAITLTLVDRFGAVTAYSLMGGGFALLGLLAAAVVAVREHEEEVADTKAEKGDTADVASDAATQAAVQLPIALLGTLLTTPMGPGFATGGLKAIGRNLPLVLLLALVALLFWPTSKDAAETEENADEHEHADQPVTAGQSAGNGIDRHAA